MTPNKLQLPANLAQVEYLVVTYAKDEPKVLLSLRQAEILAALASDHDLAKEGGCTAEQQNSELKQAQYGSHSCQSVLSTNLIFKVQTRSRLSS